MGGIDGNLKNSIQLVQLVRVCVCSANLKRERERVVLQPKKYDALLSVLTEINKTVFKSSKHTSVFAL